MCIVIGQQTVAQFVEILWQKIRNYIVGAKNKTQIEEREIKLYNIKREIMLTDNVIAEREKNEKKS